MKYKNCPGCRAKLPLDRFGKNKSAKDGLQDYCRECRRAIDADRYAKSAPRRKQIADRNRQNRDNKYKLMLTLLESSKCMDCGLCDPVVMEFDHVNGVQKANIADMMQKGHSWSAVLEEIAKCEIVCANCHRHRTSRRAGWYRSLT